MERALSKVKSFWLVVAAATIYLPLLGRIGFSNDDWYLMYAARVAGPGIFAAIFSIDRPLRAFVLGPAYMLFGQNALLYNLSAWGLRVTSALLLLWMLRKLWPGRAKATLAMSLLYLLYPGFLSQPNGIDYQSQMVSLVAAMLSLGLTAQAFFEKRAGLRLVWMGLSVLLGWLYLGLVEYEAGFEFLRLGLLFTLIAREIPGLRPRLAQTLKAWLPYLVIPLAFGIWRVFIFQGERKATSLGAQLGEALAFPGQTIVGWLSRIFLDTLNILVSAWGVPLYQLSAKVTALDVLIGVVIGAILVALVLLILRQAGDDAAPTAESDWRIEAIWLGLATVVIALVPVVLANRQVGFPDYSRYTLVSSVGAGMAIVAGLHYLASRKLQTVVFSLLLLISFVTQYTNAALAAAETASMRDFWWQVSWRIPQLETNTTLVAHYPIVSIQEDYFVWGPANLIYYPEKVNNLDYVQPGIYAAVPNDDTVTKVLIRMRQEYDKRRTIRTYANYRNILILTQPTTKSCVQVINGTQPEISPEESANFQLMAPYSEIEHILADEKFHTPPQDVFGAEPAHGWCYFYQKAALARQRGDWSMAAQLGDEAISQGVYPSDQVEWMPFIQAYAVVGNKDRVEQLSAQFSSGSFLQLQACQILSKTGGLSADVQQQVQTLYCAAP